MHLICGLIPMFAAARLALGAIHAYNDEPFFIKGDATAFQGELTRHPVKLLASPLQCRGRMRRVPRPLAGGREGLFRGRKTVGKYDPVPKGINNGYSYINFEHLVRDVACVAILSVHGCTSFPPAPGVPAVRGRRLPGWQRYPKTGRDGHI